MGDIVAVSKDRHADCTWRRPTNFLFAAKDPVAVLVAQEVPRAMLHMALGFMEGNGVPIIVSIQSLRPGQNWYVSSDGRWLGEYIPATYRTQPFKLARDQQGNEVLCVDEAAAQVSTSINGEPFFQPDGTPANAVAEVIKMLGEMEADRLRTQNACESLKHHGLLEPWPLKMQDGEQFLEAKGVMRISEAKLYGLDPVSLAEVRNSGGLMLAFAQLFSMSQIHKLPALSVSSATATVATGPKLADHNGIISFANF